MAGPSGVTPPSTPLRWSFPVMPRDQELLGEVSVEEAGQRLGILMMFRAARHEGRAVNGAREIEDVWTNR